MKNIFIAVAMLVIIFFMSRGHTQTYDDYLDGVDNYSDCYSSNFSGWGGCDDGAPPAYDPCQSNFSGGPECAPPEEEPCAVYVIESGNLHLNDVYIEGLISVDYIKMINKDGTFHLEEISP